MKKTVGIVFQKAGKIYWYDAGDVTYTKDEAVVVSTERGDELGRVLIPDGIAEGHAAEEALLPITRIATAHDLKVYEDNLAREEEAFAETKALIAESGLDMKLLECHYTLSGNRLIVTYAADDRVDFRQLLRDLSSMFKIRIEMKQVGSRDAGRYLGGIGSCGRVLCCASYMRDFGLVTMRMAKEQEMSLASNKISGLCGKLLCCIGYEHDFYEEQRAKVPGTGERVKTPNQENTKVLSADMFHETVRVLNGDKFEVWNASEVERLKPFKPDECKPNASCPRAAKAAPKGKNQAPREGQKGQARHHSSHSSSKPTTPTKS